MMYFSTILTILNVYIVSFLELASCSSKKLSTAFINKRVQFVYRYKDGLTL